MPPDGPRMTITDANFSGYTKWKNSQESRKAKQSVRSLPCNQTSTTKCCWCRQLCSGTAAGCNPGFWLWETFQSPERREKKRRKDRPCCRANSGEEDKQLKWYPASQRELQRGFTLDGRKGLRTGFCSHMQRDTVNPPPYLPPTALTNSHCLYLSFPSVPTINCPFCGGINSLARC